MSVSRAERRLMMLSSSPPRRIFTSAPGRPILVTTSTVSLIRAASRPSTKAFSEISTARMIPDSCSRRASSCSSLRQEDRQVSRMARLHSVVRILLWVCVIMVMVVCRFRLSKNKIQGQGIVGPGLVVAVFGVGGAIVLVISLAVFVLMEGSIEQVLYAGLDVQEFIDALGEGGIELVTASLHDIVEIAVVVTQEGQHVPAAVVDQRQFPSFCRVFIVQAHVDDIGRLSLKGSFSAGPVTCEVHAGGIDTAVDEGGVHDHREVFKDAAADEGEALANLSLGAIDIGWSGVGEDDIPVEGLVFYIS